MPTSTGAKSGYLAQGDAISPTSQGPDEPVVNETSVMSATRFRDLQDANAEIRRFASTAQMHGGIDVAKKGRLFVTAKAAAGTGDTVTVTPALAGYDATAKILTGHCPLRAADSNVVAQPASDFDISTDTSSLQNIPFEATVATDYNVGIALSIVPSRAAANSRTGKYEFDRETSIVGVTATPASVAYNSGTDTTTFTLSGQTLLGGGDSLVGRAAMAWFTDPSDGGPLGVTAVAIAFGTITNTGSNVLTVSGGFGQTTPSTTAAEYHVCVLGPAIWSSATVEADEDGVAHIAYGSNSGGWSADSQRVYPTTFAMLENFVSMLAPSVSSPDLVALPKISIRPNDNEAGTTKQIEVWKDAAATSLAFSVDKDGVLYFDGDIIAADPTSPLSFGIDDANQTSIQRAINVFHEYNGGFAADGIGTEIGLQVEDEGGNRIDVGQISAQAVDATAATIDSVLKLGRVEGSALKSDVLIDSKGAVVIEAQLVGMDDADYYPRVSGGSPPALTVVGGAAGPEPLGRLRIWNHDGNDGSGTRVSRLEFYGNQGAAGTKVKQAELSAHHGGPGSADDIGSLSIGVNDGVAAEPASLPVFVTLNGDNQSVDFVKQIRMSSSTQPIHSDIFRNRDTAVNDLDFKIANISPSGVGEMRDTHLSNGTMGSGNILRNTFALEDSGATLEVAQTDSIYISGSHASREFKVLSGGALERMLVLNGERDHVVVLADPALEPFDAVNAAGIADLSPFQVIHDLASGSIANAGIDLASDELSNGDGNRHTGLNFLGRLAAGTRHRMAGVRGSHDGTNADYAGKVEIFANNSGTSDADAMTNKATFFADGDLQSKTTSRGWARATATPTLVSSFGLSNPTKATTGQFLFDVDRPVGHNSGAVVVSVRTAAYTGYGQFETNSTAGDRIRVYIFDNAGGAADAAFDVSTFAAF